LDDVQDVNQVLRYFSYEHFYVLYCRFWELDSDRDQLVSLADLQQYSQGSLTTAVLQRVVSGAARKLTSGVPGKLDFEDFIYFCLSEEDKNHPQAIYYWFRALDVDCDGILSGYELGKFYEENQGRFMDLTGDDSLKFEDMLCQMLDMVGAYRVKSHGLQGVTLADLKACESTGHFFDMVFNASKFMSFEHRDPFAEHQQKLQQEKTDWDRFARLEYDRMANEVS
jgi:serine/threonine-protein phosphatase 2A regulatory subunit B''